VLGPTAYEHLVKLHAWPSGPLDHWSIETRACLLDARRAYTPSMRSRLDIPALHADALALLDGTSLAGEPPRPVRPDCPFTLDDLIHPGALPSIPTLLAKLASPERRP